MQVIERYKQSCPKEYMNISDKCYHKDDLSIPKFCKTGYRFDNSISKCVTDDTNKYIRVGTDGKCGNNSTLISTTKSRMCVSNELVKPPECNSNFLRLPNGQCFNNSTRTQAIGCSGGEIRNNECIINPITVPTCPPNPFTGDPLILEKGICK